MDFSQTQERLRLELLRRIKYGTMSVSLLARQTGLGQPHVSNFLHGRRNMSLEVLDKVLKAQRLTVEDLLPARRGESDLLMPERAESMDEVARIPLVGHAVAIWEPYMRPSSVQAMLPFAGELLRGLDERCQNARRQWDRFVAVRISVEDARGMEPVLQADGLVVLDRHYTSFQPYREGGTNLFAAKVGTKTGARLVVRYAQHDAGRVVLRSHAARMKVAVLEPEAGETANDLLVGRVVMVINRDQKDRDQGSGISQRSVGSEQ
jgi:transcriptional regulator with XRE-family HTH domain